MYVGLASPISFNDAHETGEINVNSVRQGDGRKRGDFE
jgi:hypothetical protein